MSGKVVLTEVAQSPKIAGAVSTATVGTGFAEVLNLIPDEIGKLATLVGIVLSSVLIYTHWRKGHIEYRKVKLEIAALEERQAERLEIARKRKVAGEPTRRSDDLG